jgi:hypothetical protein
VNVTREPGVAGCGEEREMTDWTIDEPRRLTLDEDVKRLDVSLIAGRLNVVGVTEGPARLEVRPGGDVPVSVSLEDGVLTVRHQAPETWPGMLAPVWWWLSGRRKVSADVSLAIPVETPAALRVVAGSVVASGLAADLSADCTSGRVTLLGITGRIRAKIISGPIEAVGCVGDFTLETVSGEITLADSMGATVRAKTMSGAITADLDRPSRSGEISLDTTSGEITIRVPEDSDLDVGLNAIGGRVTTVFPGLTVERGAGSSVHGVLGAGTVRLRAHAVSGNISLLARPVDEDFDGSGEPEGGEAR